LQDLKKHRPTGFRPSLLSSTKPAAPSGERILTTLSDGSDIARPERRLPWRSHLALVILLATLGAGAAAYWYAGHRPSQLQVDHGAVAPTAPPPTAKAGQEADTASTEPLPAKRGETEAAAIIADGVGHNRTSASGIHAASEPTAAGTRTQQPQASRAAGQGASGPVPVERRDSRHASVAHQGKKQRSTASGEAHPVVDPVARQMDGDLNLLSALVSHATERDQAAATKAAGAAQASTKK
jgi:hypothetical protein